MVARLSAVWPLLTIKIGRLNTGHGATNWVTTAYLEAPSEGWQVTNNLYCRCVPHDKCFWEIECGSFWIDLQHDGPNRD